MLSLFPNECFSQTSAFDRALQFLDSMFNLYHKEYIIYDDNFVEMSPHYEGNFNDILVNQNDSNRKEGKYCGKIIFKHKDTLYGNVRITRGPENFGSYPGADLSGATKISFILKGHGYIEVAIGGTNLRPFHNLFTNYPYNDGVDVRGTGIFPLTSNWVQHDFFIKEDTTFYVYKSALQGVNNRYPQIVFLEDAFSNNDYLKVEPNSHDEKGHPCMKAIWKKPSDSKAWAGRLFFPPEKGFGPNQQGYDLTGIKGILLKMKSSKPNTGIRLVFGTDNDSSGNIILETVITTEWRQYYWQLPQDKDYSNIVGGMGFALSKNFRTPDSVDIFFDTIKYDNVFLKTDLSHLITGISIIAPSDLNKDSAVVYFDRITYNKNRLNEPRFPLSFVTPFLSKDPSQTYASHVYDASLMAIAFLSYYCNTKDIKYLENAKHIGDAFIYCMEHDRFFKDHRLRNVYSIGTLENHLGNSSLAGFVLRDTARYVEDKYFDGSAVGNICWAGITLTSLYEATNNIKYLRAAQKLADWVIDSTYTQNGFKGGFEGFDSVQTKLEYKATEHNIDAAVLFFRLNNIEKNKKYSDALDNARKFVESMRDLKGFYYTGTDSTGITPNKSNFVLDVHPWSTIALQDYNTDRAKIAIQNAIDSCYISDYKSINYDKKLNGYDFNGNKDGIWLEGTMEMATAFSLMGRTQEAQKLWETAEYLQVNGKNNDGKGLVAADHDSVNTGFNWLYFNWLHVAPTAWFVISKLCNPYYYMCAITPLNVAPQVSNLNIKNFPNPFSSRTTFFFDLKEISKVQINVYDSFGKKLNTLISSTLPPGLHSVDWNGQTENGALVSSGIYLTEFRINNVSVAAKKVMVMR